MNIRQDLESVPRKTRLTTFSENPERVSDEAKHLSSRDWISGGFASPGVAQNNIIDMRGAKRIWKDIRPERNISSHPLSSPSPSPRIEGGSRFKLEITFKACDRWNHDNDAADAADALDVVMEIFRRMSRGWRMCVWLPHLFFRFYFFIRFFSLFFSFPIFIILLLLYFSILLFSSIFLVIDGFIIARMLKDLYNITKREREREREGERGGERGGQSNKHEGSLRILQAER